jgi:methylglutaconyl-CoA hydratase
MAKYSAEQNKADSRQLFDMFHAIKTCPVPVIGRINGSALGGGAGLVSVCDVALAIEKAQFGFTEVKLGLIPAVISPFVMEKIGAGLS